MLNLKEGVKLQSSTKGKIYFWTKIIFAVFFEQQCKHHYTTQGWSFRRYKFVVYIFWVLYIFALTITVYKLINHFEVLFQSFKNNIFWLKLCLFSSVIIIFWHHYFNTAHQYLNMVMKVKWNGFKKRVDLYWVMWWM